MSKKLNVYLNNTLYGTIIFNKNNVLFNYSNDLSINELMSLPLSFSLLSYPSPKWNKVKIFIENLKNENQRWLKVHQLEDKFDFNNNYEYFKMYGIDCLGAIKFIEPGKESSLLGFNDNLKAISLEEIDVNMDCLYSNEQLTINEKNQMISLSGVQGKIGLTFKNNSWYVSNGTTPSTHILKVGLKNVSNQELMEFYSLEILKQIIGKESVVDCELKITPKGNEYLISKRYDREIINNQIMRIHQEDFCQVLSISHYQKYEYQNGVNSKMIIDFLRKYSSNPLKDINIFVKTLFLNYILLCPDGHGKNYSFLIKKDNFRLAPIYDFCSVAHLTKEQMRGGLNEIAMSIDGVKIFCTIKSANIKRFLQKNNLDINEYKNELLIICKALPNIIEKIFNTYKDKYSSLNLLYYNINKNLLKSIKLFEEELLKL